MKKLVSLLTLALLANPAWAALDIDQYIGVNYSWGNMDIDGGYDYDLDGIQIRYGQYVTPHFGVEVHYLFGTSDANLVPDTDAFGKISDKHTASVFLRGEIGTTFKLYGLVGWSWSKFEASGGAISPVAREESDLSYGAGIAYYMDKDLALDINYIMYHDEDYFNFSGTSIGFTYDF